MINCGALAQFEAGGITIGQAVPDLSAQGYQCSPSTDFPGLTSCRRNRAAEGSSRETSVVLHAADGIAVYAMSYVSPLSLTKAAAEASIATISRKPRHGQARVEWKTQDNDRPQSVIASWGDVRLEQLGLAGELALAEGRSAKQGMLVDLMGDMTKSAKEGGPIYRLMGGTGVVYTARLGQGAESFRRISAIDATAVLTKKYEAELQVIFQRDRLLPASDVSLWHEAAEKSRRMALDTSLVVTDSAHDRVAQRAPSKLASKLWARLPGSVIDGLRMHAYRPGYDHYGTKTGYPEIRRALQDYVTANPRDPFIEFGHFALGQPDVALSVRPESEIRDVLHYAVGHRVLRRLVRDMVAAARARKPTAVPGGFEDSDRRVGFLNESAEIFNNQPIAQFVPTYSARARAIRPHFEAVLSKPEAAHADDAAYFLGFLARHEGDNEKALKHLEQALVVGNDDYKLPAMRQVIRILTSYPSEEQIQRVESNEVFRQKVPLVYAAARSAYREHKYQRVIGLVEDAIPRFKLPISQFPATTDPVRVESALRRLMPEGEDSTEDYDDKFEIHIIEMLYLAEASREMQDYIDQVRATPNERLDAAFAQRAKSIVSKYGAMRDRSHEESNIGEPALEHKDLRQALHLIDVTLEKNSDHSEIRKLGEWLRFKKARILSAFDPRSVAAAVAAFRQEFPQSRLGDDVVAEQMFVEAFRLRDFAAAQLTFGNLLESYPGGNALDNAHNWMAIVYYCQDKKEEAERVDREIATRFPLTRHARYARSRLASADAAPGPGSELCLAEDADIDPNDEDVSDVEELEPEER